MMSSWVVPIVVSFVAIGFLLGRASNLVEVAVAQYKVTQLAATVEQQNTCIEHWAESVSRFDGTDAQRCEFMLSNRLVCLVGR